MKPKVKELKDINFLKKNAGSSLRQVAKKLGCTASALRRAYKKLGVERDNRVIKYPELANRQFLLDHIGKSNREIAKIVGCEQSAVTRAYTRHGIPRERKAKVKPKGKEALTKEFLEANAHRDNNDIAKEVGTTYWQVWNAFKKHNIPRSKDAYKPLVPVRMGESAKDWNNPAKNEARNVVLSTKRKFKSILMLPGDQCLDVRQMLEEGSINLDTHITVVERDPEIFLNIDKTIKNLGFNSVHMMNTELTSADLGDRVYDFMYLDTCSELTLRMVSWLVRLIQTGNLAENGVVALGLARFRGASEVMHLFQKFMIRHNLDISEDFNPAGELSEVMREQHNVIGTMLEHVLGPCMKSMVYKSEGHAIGMHVFSFQTRKQNRGVMTVIKFLMENGEEPALISPGIKAAVKRKKLQVLNKPQIVSRNDRKSVVATGMDDLKEQIKALTERVTSLEESRNELVHIPEPVDTPSPDIDLDEDLDLFRPVADKVTVQLRLDEDLVHWFRMESANAGTDHLQDMERVLQIFRKQYEDRRNEKS